MKSSTIVTNVKNEIIAGYRCVLIKLTCKDGTIYGYTDHELQLTVDGQLYIPAPGLQKTSVHMTASTEVSNQDFAAAWIDAPEADLLSGKWDNADIEIRLCSWNNPGLGSFVVDKGNLGLVQWTSDGFQAEMYSQMKKLETTIGFQVTATCRHQLFSQFDNSHCGACTLNSASFTFTGSVSSTSDGRTGFVSTSLGKTTNYFDNGILTWTSGNNNGRKQEVKSFVVTGNATWKLFLPAEKVIQVGDTFSVTAGCDKTLTTCKNKFNNVVNFGGFPHIQVEVQYR